MKLVYIAIIPMIVLAIISILLGSDFVSIEIQYVKYNPIDKDFPAQTMTFSIDETETQLIFLITLITVSAVVGVQILGSGLADTSVRVIIIIIVALAVFGICSVLAWDLMFLNRTIGTVVYIFLLIIYVIGVGQQISGGE